MGLFDARVPRYTSYPTAPHFSSALTAEDYRGWLQALPENATVSLYLHVPFCRRLCWFCACRTQGTTNDDPVRAYARVIQAELKLLKQRLPRGVRLSRLHWGGGTPTLMSPDLMREVAGAIFDLAPLGPEAEFSVEIDPNEIDDARLDALVAVGMNRASIGVQDFDPAIQQTIGRDQSFEVTRDVAVKLRARGIGSLNADILFGLPDQTPAGITESVQKLLSLSPDRVALYGYAHVPWMARRQVMIPSDRLPRPEERLRLFEAARALFVADGYAEVGIDHFARPGDGLAVAAREGRLRRNFQGYTDDQATALIGVGASAISRFPGGYAQNDPSTSGYTRRIGALALATTRGHAFTGEDLLRARMIEALMCDFRIDSDEMRQRFGLSPAALDQILAPVLRQFGEVVIHGPEGLSIPVAARPLTRMIARSLDTYALSETGHSHAV